MNEHRRHDQGMLPDQAQGLRRQFAGAGVQLVPVVSNPHVMRSGVLLDRLCAALAEQGAHTLVVDAGESAPAADELSVMGLGECIERLSNDVFYLAARTLPLRYVDARGSTAPFLQAVVDAAPQCEVVLVHASASDLARMFARQTLAPQVRPLLLADDRPASVTHAYASMKLLALRAQLMIYHLLLGAAPSSPRAARIAEHLAICADTFLGALLHSSARVDTASRDADPPLELLRLSRAMLAPTSPALHAVGRTAADELAEADVALIAAGARQARGAARAMN